MQDQNNLDEFASRLLSAKGQADTEDVRSALLSEINDRIDRALLEALPGDQIDAIENALNTNSATEEMITGILENADIDSEAIITKTLEDFRDEYLGRE